MKTLAFAVLLMVALAFVVAGCSDNSAPPVSPTDRSASQPGPLGKVFSRSFTTVVGPFSTNPYEVVLDPGFTKSPDGRMFAKGLLLKTFLNATFAPGDQGIDLVSGDGVLEMNFTGDLAAGENITWGKLTVTPYAPEAEGGVWEITWNGKGRLTEGGWVVPLKQVGVGKGGALTGMQLTGDLTITLWEVTVGWTGTGNGSITAH